ncbi:MAG: bifunctional 5,10-methylenetetrahydrofolate dehydrogenase/5,10-methenyltetrahydrofolate cyclohydrolase [Firmicutes bacterium]|nr:bifunctional 5,10-methylenetetrahydrofolate dehydrogenase/5,10-methenyltetrahydrofolate cyclohydrolase [Bacillota bacterium]
MAAKVISGVQVTRKVREELRVKIATLRKKGIAPGLAIVVLKNPAARVHVARLKERACRQLGIKCKVHCLPENTTKEEFIQLLKQLNTAPEIHGINIHPLPPHFNLTSVSQLVAPNKDIEGLHFQNMGNLCKDSPPLIPYVAKGIMKLIETTGVNLENKQAVVVGRSELVGKPVAALLLNKRVIVSICHSQTIDLVSFTKRADLLVVATGNPRLITAEMVKKGAIVIDVGVNLTGTRLVGDVDYWGVEKVAGWITPVPGGVGPVTISMLLTNLLDRAARSS